MSGVLSVAGGLGGAIRPFLIPRSLTSSGVWSTHHTVALRFQKNGVLETRENGVYTPRTPEWTGQTVSRFTIGGSVWSGGNFDVRCLVLSGDVELDLEFSTPGTWYSLTDVLGGSSITFISQLEPATSATLTGVWRVEIRNGDTGAILTRADYNVSATCTSGC